MNPETLVKLQSAAGQPGKAGKEARQVLEAMGLPVASPRAASAPVKVPAPEAPEQTAPEQAAPVVRPRAPVKVTPVVKAPEQAAPVAKPAADVPAWLVRLVLGSRAAYASVRRAVLVACVVVLVIVTLTSIPLWAMLLSRY